MTIDLPYAHADTLTPNARYIIRSVVHREFPGEEIRLFSGDSPLPSAELIDSVPDAEFFIVAALNRMRGTLPAFPEDVLFIDIETHGADLRWDMPSNQFVRLCQYAWGEGSVKTTTNLQEFLKLTRRARVIVAHNGHSFDFSVLYGDSALDMAASKKLFDTWPFAVVNVPAPKQYRNRYGRVLKSDKPASSRGWFSLDNLAFQFGIPGKLGDITELAKRFNPPGTLKADLDYGLIPTDDPDFLAYAEQDIVTLRELLRSFMSVKTPNAYDWRMQFTSAIDAQMTRNGVRVDADLAQGFIDEQERVKDETMARLVEKYGFPTEGKMPWRTKAGKAALFSILEEYGITPKTHSNVWPKTSTGNPSLSGDALVQLTEGTPAESLGKALAVLQGQRPLAQQALDHLHKDGKVHPDIDALQRSGRRCLPSTHRILTKRGILWWDEVRPGEDETLDMRNRWVKITQVHHYGDAVVNRYETRSSFLEATPNHRWVNRTENGRREVSVVPFSTRGQRRVLQLTPDCYPFDKDEHFYPQGMTDRERLAALVGLLVTDGSCKIRSGRDYPYIRIYQTEGKFYDLFMSLIPSEWVTNDHVRYPDDYRGVLPAKTPMHEVSLDWHIVGPLLEAEGLEFSEGLRHSDTLLPWLLSLNQQETLAFLTSVYLADGGIKSGGVNISTLNKNIVPIFQIAAYRCGRRSNYRVYETVNGLKGDLHLLQDRTSTRSYAGGNVSSYNTDVWCVTTETGTFTAWYPEGRWSGPYLTGNSVTSPGMTTWGARSEQGQHEKAYFVPDKGWSMFEVDLSNADQRAVAFMSRDLNYAKRFEPGVDGHELTGRLMYGDELYDSDPKKYRRIAKALGHGYSYGASAKKLSITSGEPIEVAEHFVATMEKHYPDMIQWQNRVRHEGTSGWVTNLWGRKMPVDEDRSYTQAPALLGQSSTTEILYDGLIRLYYANPDILKRGVLFPVHDAITVQAPDACVQEWMDVIVRCLHNTINGIEILAEHGPAAKNWAEAGH